MHLARAGSCAKGCHARTASAIARPATPAVTVAAVAALCLAITLRDALTLRLFLFVFGVSGLILLILLVLSHSNPEITMLKR